jgi:formylmethanofuran dehydrogenase subunit E
MQTYCDTCGEYTSEERNLHLRFYQWLNSVLCQRCADWIFEAAADSEADEDEN